MSGTNRGPAVKPRSKSGAAPEAQLTPGGFDAEALREQLVRLAIALPTEPPDLTGIRKQSLRNLKAEVERAARALNELERWLDPIGYPDAVFDPSNPAHSAEIIGIKLESLPRIPMNTISPMHGSGVYALYYMGTHPAYTEIRETDVPIYVGKAEPKDSQATNPVQQGPQLFNRLQEHTKSIRLAEEYATASEGRIQAIRLSEFECRYLVTSGAYVGAVEANLIRRYFPPWNTVCPGFGKHGDSHTTRANTRSEWDTLHPGRRWATHEGNIPNTRSAIQIQEAIIEDLRTHRPPRRAESSE